MISISTKKKKKSLHGKRALEKASVWFPAHEQAAPQDRAARERWAPLGSAALRGPGSPLPRAGSRARPAPPCWLSWMAGLPRRPIGCAARGTRQSAAQALPGRCRPARRGAARDGAAPAAVPVPLRRCRAACCAAVAPHRPPRPSPAASRAPAVPVRLWSAGAGLCSAAGGGTPGTRGTVRLSGNTGCR